MRYIRDNTGQFPERPYFEAGELDELCERVIEEFLRKKYGEVCYPIRTDGLQVLIEQQPAELDCYSDLSSFGEDTQGATVFEPDGPTRVFISKELSEHAARENRFRTTLSHEVGHILLHGPLYRAARTGDLFEGNGSTKATCTRRSIELAQTNWLEWQAGYVSGALLMPLTPLRALAQSILKDTGPVAMASPAAKALIEAAMRAFQVSRHAAEVRLQQANLITACEVRSLF
jgi:IrrE N-terminal-like domain